MQRFKYDLKITLVLLAIRKLRNLKIINVAISLGIDRTTYGRIEKGEIMISYSRLEEIAIILKVPLKDILTITDVLNSVDVNSYSAYDLYCKINSPGFPETGKTTFSKDQLYLIFLIIKRFYSKAQYRALISQAG